MKSYHFTAIDQSGKQHQGTIEADGDKHARYLLREKGLIVIEASSIDTNAPSVKNRQKIKVRDLALITRQLATLIAANLPIEQALQGVAEQSEKKELQKILLAVRTKVLEGHSLAFSLKTFPKAFPELYCATVDAGEQTGKLDIVLNRLADYTEKQLTMRSKIQQALIYPAVMTVISISIIIFLLTFVVPKIIGVFNTTGQRLPDLTIILISISDFIKHYGIYCLVAMLLGLVVLKKMLNREEVKLRFHQILLKLPLVSYLIRSINTSRFSHTLAILSSGGVPILKSMSVASNLLTSLPIAKAVSYAISQVREGRALSSALKQTGFFSPMTVHLIASGENSGQLEKMLEHAAHTQDEDVKRIIDTLLSLFEPFIILFMGAIVLFIVLATLLPIFSMDQLVH